MSLRKIIGRVLQVLGVFEVLLACAINTWTGKWFKLSFYRSENSYDIQAVFQFFLVSLIVGALTILLGRIIEKKRIAFFDNYAFAFLLFSILVIVDRGLLLQSGLSVRMNDAELHYKYRPNAKTTYARGDQQIFFETNRYGFHDNDFSMKKPENELRFLMVGDSITEGQAVNANETFSVYLEEKLRKNEKKYDSYEVINIGIAGYTTWQEYGMMKRFMRADPDVIFVGFCMNDVTEPIAVDRRLGGTGLSTTGILHIKSSLLGYLYHETGFGRLMQRTRLYPLSLEHSKLAEVYNVKFLESHLARDPKIIASWKNVLENLSKIYKLAKDKDKKVVLLIFPHTFQLVREDFMGSPQTILKQHARQHDVDFIDFTVIFRNSLYGYVERLQGRGLPGSQINALAEIYLLEYFLDHDHYTPQGHDFVAETIYYYLKKNMDILR